nr:putative ribonuclease H-like domain-containing protein [Tanacetum cinerariifolium]
MDSLSPQVVSAAKMPILNPNEFDLWKMRIDQYFLMIDYSLWEVILNGYSLVPTRIIKGILQPVAPTTTEQKLARKNELKAHGSHSESLGQIHDRLQKLVSQLEIHKVSLSQEDVNLNTTESVSVAASVFAVCAKILVSSLPNVDSLSKNLGANGPTSMSFDMSKVECYNCHRKRHFAREYRSPKDSRKNSTADPQRRTVPVKTSTSNALVSQCDGVRSYDWSYQAEDEPANYALMAFSSLSSSSDNEVSSCSKACSKAYAQLHSQYNKLTGDFCKSQFDVISYQTGLEFVEARLLVYKQNEYVFEENIKLLNIEVQLRDNALVTLRQKLEKVEQEKDDLKIVPSSVQSFEQVKSPRHSVQHIETTIPATTPKPASPKSASSGKRRNRKACFVCKSLDHLIKDCDYHAKKMAQPTQRNHAHRGKMGMETKMPNSRPSFLYHKCINDGLIIMGNPQHALKDKGVIDSRCSRYMTGNMSYLSDFKELNGRYVAFGGNPKGDSLGKFEEKVDKGFLVGYSVSSKAFRVFNSRTRIVQEILHANFLENKPNVPGSGPTWLFDIDSLTRTMNYQPVTARNQTKPSAGFQDKFDAEKEGEEIDQQYVLFPMWSSGSTNPLNNDEDAAFDGKEHDFDAKKPESEVSVSPSSSAQSRKQDDKTKKEAKGKNASQLPDDPDMPELEDITYSDDEDDVGAKADFNNLETSITVSLISTTRVHKDHPVSQIIGDLSSTTQTRSMTRVEEGIDYEEVFAPVARIEAIRLFLAYASFMGFMVYQMDVKSAFPYRTIEKEVYVCQPLGFEDPDHPDKVYKVVKALYGLHQAPRAWYETLASYLMENGFQRGKIYQTLFIKGQKRDILLV